MASRRKHSKSSARCYVISQAPLPETPARAGIQAVSGRARLAARARRRIGMCGVVLFAAYAMLAGRLVAVSLGGVAAPGGANTPVADVGPRPEIVDRNGVILATNLPMIALEVAGREVWDADETAASLAAAFPQIEAGPLAEKLREGRYVEVLANITPAQQEAAFALGLPGVRFGSRKRRFYPHGGLAAHVLGHLEPGKGGVMGLERVLDKKKSHEAMAAALDIRAQQALEDELARAIDEFSAEAGWGAVLDVATGEIIALASLPDFDTNAPGAAAADSRRNRATYDRYELGSAFKPLTIAAAIEAGVAEEATIYDARGVYRVADRTISDFHGENRLLSLSEVIQYSSNIGAARVAADLGLEKQKEFLAALGLFEPLSIELAENRPPELPPQWGPVEAATIAYGHGISVTPLHLLAAFTAVINDGVYRTPTFLQSNGARSGERVFSRATVTTMRRILRRVITDGTAEFADVEGYFPIGKTATAEKVAATGGYATDARITSFVGAFPGHEPRYSILVSLDNPQATPSTFGYATAGWNAAPLFARLVARLGPVLGVMPVSEEEALAGFAGAEVSRDNNTFAPVGAIGGGA